MPKMGRPTKRTPRVEFVLLGRIMQGKSLRSICKRRYMPHEVTILRWLAADHEFRRQYAEAMEVRQHAMFEEIQDISDDAGLDVTLDQETGIYKTEGEVVARARLRMDARKWMLSRMNPRKYGEKVEVEQTGRVDVTKIKIIELKPAGDSERRPDVDLDLIPYEGKA